jgi:hypothetical protein
MDLLTSKCSSIALGGISSVEAKWLIIAGAHGVNLYALEFNAGVLTGVGNDNVQSACDTLDLLHSGTVTRLVAGHELEDVDVLLFVRKLVQRGRTRRVARARKDYGIFACGKRRHES